MSSKSERVILTNPNSSLVLKELVLEDARPYFDLVDSCRAHLSQFGDDTAQKYPNVKSVSTSIKRPKPGRTRFGIWLGEVFIGSINIHKIGAASFMGYWIGEQYTGHNYARQARSLLIAYAFEVLGLESLICHIHPENIASIRSVLGSGFVYVGDLCDMREYVLAKDDWMGCHE